jgi:hypothetical protein
VAEVIGPYAAAANLCLASEQVGGMQFYSKRHVFPRIGADWVLPFPTLVWIELTQFNQVFT